MMPANGEVSSDSIALPHGTVVAVSEVLPVLGSGVEWAKPQYSHETFVIDATWEEPFTIDVENTVNDTRKPPPNLSETGANGATPLWLAATLLLVAAGVTFAARSRRTNA